MATTTLIDLECVVCGDTYYVHVPEWHDGEPWICPLCKEVEVETGRKNRREKP